MTAPARDRFIALEASTAWNGIDFVEVDPIDHTILRVHFVNAAVDVAEPGIAALITGGDRIPTIETAAIAAGDWGHDPEGRPLLTVYAAEEGDFSTYRLSLPGATKLDRAFSSADFSFKVFCPSDFDCAPRPPDCPPDDTDTPPIDYLAKDFLSFKQALSDFSALRYPQWQERAEADFGVMFMEALCAVGDELSYLQDRIGAEAAIDTATQRLSLINLARLVDYEPRPATSASTTLLCTVADTPIAAGVRVSAVNPDGLEVPFEIGTGLNDATSYPVSPAWNYPIPPYWWDDADRCLARGSTEMWLQATGLGLRPGVQMLIQTDLPGDSLRQIVTLTEVEEAVDPLFPPGGPPTPLTRIAWGVDDALLRDRDLTLTSLGGNLLPASQGVRASETFAIGAPPSPGPAARPAVARQGANATEAEPNWIYRYPLATAPLTWLALPADASADPTPELRLQQLLPDARPWPFARHLLDVEGEELAFTVDAQTWRRLDTGLPGVEPRWDVDGDGGETLRFGDGTFGTAPDEGDVFRIDYRTGLGALGNVAADSIGKVDLAWTATLTGARNPFGVTDGADAETAEHVRRMAPQAFRAKQFRAVRREDYETSAEELPWVQQASTAFRWTGSWLTVFTAADPEGEEGIPADQLIELIELLNRRRLAGYESYAPQPRYVSIDLQIEVCVAAGAISGDVEEAVVTALGGGDSGAGFFFADHFSFGAPLYRSRLEAAIQAVPDVSGVRSITYRQRGVIPGYIDLPEVLALGADQILRVDNDPDHPEHGVLKVMAEGGR